MGKHICQFAFSPTPTLCLRFACLNFHKCFFRGKSLRNWETGSWSCGCCALSSSNVIYSRISQPQGTQWESLISNTSSAIKLSEARKKDSWLLLPNLNSIWQPLDVASKKWVKKNVLIQMLYESLENEWNSVLTYFLNFSQNNNINSFSHLDHFLI